MPAAPSTAPRAATARTRAEAAPSTATAVAAPRHDDDNGLREKLRPIFAKFDISGDGQVSVGELRGILSAANVKLSADEIRSVVMEADADSSGSLSFDEFYSALSKQLGDASKRGDLSGGLLRGGLLSIVHDTGGFLNFNFNPLQWLPSAIFTAPLPGAPPADEPSQPPPAPAAAPVPSAGGGRRVRIMSAPVSAPAPRHRPTTAPRLSVRSKASMLSESLVRQRNAEIGESTRVAEANWRQQRQEREEAFLDRQHARVRRFRSQEKQRQLQVEAIKEQRQQSGHELRANFEHTWRHVQRMEAERTGKVGVQVQQARDSKRAETAFRHREHRRTASLVAQNAQVERARRREASLSTVRKQEHEAREFAQRVKFETRPAVRMETREFFRAQREAICAEERRRKHEDRVRRGKAHIEFLAGALGRVADVGMSDRNAAQSRAILAQQRAHEADAMRALLEAEQRRRQRNEALLGRQLWERHEAVMQERASPLVISTPLHLPPSRSEDAAIGYMSLMSTGDEGDGDELERGGAKGGARSSVSGPRTRQVLKARSRAWASTTHGVAVGHATNKALVHV